MHTSFVDLDAALGAIALADRSNVGLVFNSVWPGVTAATVDSFHARIVKNFTAVHVHRMEAPETFEFYRSLFAALEKVLTMYVALFKAFSGT